MQVLDTQSALFVQPETKIATSSKKGRRIGVAMSTLAVLFLLFDSVTKLVKIQPVIEATQRLGYPESTARPLGVVLLACIVLYGIPRTAVLVAVLLTAFLRGAIAP